MKHKLTIFSFGILLATWSTSLAVPVIIDDFTASDHYVSSGTAVTLSWTLTGEPADLSITPSVTITASQSSVTIHPTETTTYTLTATNADGTTTSTLKVGVGVPRPNIVMFLVDDMGWQDTSESFYYDSSGNVVVSAKNNLYITPNMEDLADVGMKFTRAYAMPNCSPARVSLMTGKNSARHHVTNFVHSSGQDSDSSTTDLLNSPLWITDGLPSTEVTLPKTLSDAGYRTIHVGKGHFGSTTYAKEPLNIGFERNVGGSELGHPGSYTPNYGSGASRVPHLTAYQGTTTFLTEALTLEANQLIEESVNDGAPFFLYMSHYAVHSPFNQDPRFTANYPTLFNKPLGFATLVEGMDKSLGDIIDKLKTLDVAEDTLIIFMSDNGGDSPTGTNANTPLRNKKGSRFEGGTRVPLIVAWGKADAANAFQIATPVNANTVEHDIVTVYDLFPTILNVANVALPGVEIDGQNIAPYFNQTPGEHREQIILIHYPHERVNDYFSTLHEGDWKLIYQYALDDFALYFLPDDIGENNNLAIANPDRVMAMARKMAQKLNEQGAQWPRFESDGSDDTFKMPILPEVDTDNDGISDNTEDANGNGIVDAGETNPENENSDGDNVSDGDEQRLGLDGSDAQSYFYLQAEPVINDASKITWPSAPGLTFIVESATDLKSWTTLETNYPASTSGSTTSYSFTTDAELRLFYRIRLEALAN